MSQVAALQRIPARFSPKVVLSALALGLSLVAGSAMAQSAPPPPPAAGMQQGGPMGHGMQHGQEHGWKHHGMDRMMQRMLDRVHATPEQRERIRGFQKSGMEHNRPLMEQMRGLMQQRMQVLAAPTIDLGALENLRSKQMAVADQMSKNMTQTQYEVAQVLTPAQRQQMAHLMQERMQHGKHGDMGHGPMNHGMGGAQ
jgi:Spy/CpxP family protein refolding chaperone